MSRKNKKNLVLENIKLLTAGAKGVAIGKTEDGKTVLVSGAIPGDTVNVRVKKPNPNIMKEKQQRFW